MQVRKFKATKEKGNWINEPIVSLWNGDRTYIFQFISQSNKYAIPLIQNDDTTYQFSNSIG